VSKQMRNQLQSQPEHRVVHKRDVSA